MRWLLTYCDGSSGYKTANLVTQEDAERYLVSTGDYTPEYAAETLYDYDGGRLDAVLVGEGTVLYPVPAETTEPDFEDPDDVEDEE